MTLVGGLSDKQARSIAQSYGTINIWDGAIRSGKTVASLIRWAQYVSSPLCPSGVLVVTGVTSDTIYRNVFAPLSDPLIMGKYARLTDYRSGAPTGTILGREVAVISGYDAASEKRLRGLTAAGWYADEIGLLPEQFVDQLVGRASAVGAKGFCTTNPGAPQHWFKLRYIERAWQASGPDVRHWHFTLEDNPTLSREYVETIKGLYTGMWYKRMILGLWVMAEGAIWSEFDSDRDVVDELPGGIEWLSAGIDYGTTNPFAAVLLGEAGGKLYLASEYRYDSRKAGRQLSDKQYSDGVRGWLDGYELGAGTKGVRPRYVFVDPSAASFRLQLHRDGLTNYPGDNSVTDGLRTVASLFAAGKLKVHRSCAGLIGEIPGYTWDAKAAAKGEDVPLKVNDHSCDAARYAVRTSEALWYRRVYPRGD